MTSQLSPPRPVIGRAGAVVAILAGLALASMLAAQDGSSRRIAGQRQFFSNPVPIEPGAAETVERGLVHCANLVYDRNKSSVCYSPRFLAQVQEKTNIVTASAFARVRLESAELFMYPFAIMTGEGSFRLTQDQRDNLRDYLTNGGFLVASAGCSSGAWAKEFRREIALVFPEVELTPIDLSHPIFHTVYDIDRIKTKKGSREHLEGLEIDGRIVCIFSRDGLNDTGNAGGSCCCCGGDEIRNARSINVNLLAYALTH